MTPLAAIGMLDRQIARHGQDVLLRRVVANATASVLPCRALVRGYKAEELTGGIVQGDVLVTVSPTALAGTAFDDAPPERGDSITIEGRKRAIEVAEPVRIAGALVRINLQVRG